MSTKQLGAGPHTCSLRGCEVQTGKTRHEPSGLPSRPSRLSEYRTALNDGHKIFPPQVPTKMKHFTNYQYAMEAAFRMDRERPTSLLCEQHGQDYKLIGAMFTAPARLGRN